MRPGPLDQEPAAELRTLFRNYAAGDAANRRGRSSGVQPGADISIASPQQLALRLHISDSRRVAHGAAGNWRNPRSGPNFSNDL